MTIVKINALMSGNSYPEAGVKLYNLIKGLLEQDEHIILDMDGVESFPTLFMNTSFGSLLDDFGLDAIKKKLKFRNIKKSHVERIRKYFADYASLSSK